MPERRITHRAQVTGGALLGVGANVLEQEQFSDVETGLFFARARFECEESDLDGVRGDLDALAVRRPELFARNGRGPRLLAPIAAEPAATGSGMVSRLRGKTSQVNK